MAVPNAHHIQPVLALKEHQGGKGFLVAASSA